MGVGIIVLIQTGVGILGNSLLLGLYTLPLINRHMLKPTDCILSHLVVANNLVLLKGIPHIMATFGSPSFLDDTVCKLIFYLHRVARGVSLAITCFLSVFQALKLNPNTPKWLEFSMRSSKHIGSCCLFCWISHLLLNIFIAMNVTGPRENKNRSMEKYHGYCSSPIPDGFVVTLHAALFSFSDGVCVALMVWASGSMVVVLYRHKKQVQCLHSSSLSPRPSHEVRAMGSVLLLVSLFVSCYSLSSILTLLVTLIMNPRTWLSVICMLMTSAFPTFSPLLLLARDTRVCQFCSACWRTNNFLSVVFGQPVPSRRFCYF